MKIYIPLLSALILAACSSPMTVWQVQKSAQSLDSTAQVLFFYPQAQELIVENNCDSCHALSLNTQIFDHDYSLRSYYGSQYPLWEFCDSLCLIESGVTGISQLMTELTPKESWQHFFEVLDPEEGILWEETLNPTQKAALAYLHNQSKAKYLLYPIFDTLWVNANPARQGSFKLHWAWTLWDLKNEKLLEAMSYQGIHSSTETETIDRNWHQAVLARLPKSAPRLSD